MSLIKLKLNWYSQWLSDIPGTSFFQPYRPLDQGGLRIHADALTQPFQWTMRTRLAAIIFVDLERMDDWLYRYQSWFELWRHHNVDISAAHTNVSYNKYTCHNSTWDMENLSQWIEKARSGVQMFTKRPTLSSFSETSDIDGVQYFANRLCKNLRPSSGCSWTILTEVRVSLYWHESEKRGYHVTCLVDPGDCGYDTSFWRVTIGKYKMWLAAIDLPV